MSRNRKRLTLFLIIAGALFIGFHFWRFGLPFRPDAPRIGLSVSDDLHDRVGIHRGAYDHALSRVGAQIVTLEPSEGQDNIDALLDRIDGLLLTGGSDIHPQLYGGSSGAAHGVNLERDLFEVELIKGALERDMPILGICRGHQILNVVHGGTLQDLRQKRELAKSHGPSLESLRGHPVKIVANSHLASVITKPTIQVNSFHFQAIDKLGKGLRIAAIAQDGVIEAVERADRRMVIGIQWHPDIMAIGSESHLVLFRKLVESAVNYEVQRVAEN